MDEQKNAGQQKREAPSEVPPPAPPPIDPPKPPRNPDPEGNDREDSLKKPSTISDKIMVAATIVIALGTVVSAGAIYLQWREMVGGGTQTGQIATAAQGINTDQGQLVSDNKQVLADNRQALADILRENRVDLDNALRQNRAALKAQTDAANGELAAIQQQTEISQRPWLSVEVEPGSDLIWQEGNRVTMDLNLSIKNLGKSLAKDIQVKGEIVPTHANLPVDIRTLDKQSELCDGTQIVPPSFKFDLFPTDQPLTEGVSASADSAEVEAQANEIQEQGDRRFVSVNVVGCVIYHSSFETQPRRTYFAFRLIGSPFPFQKGEIPKASELPVLLGYFELGATVPKDRLLKIIDFSARNDAE
jgi:ElaB/YqjD/DUF883 family membrane-anchored ribosome-binding protein